MTFREARENGYCCAFESWHMGYVSRKSDINELPVYEANGRRKGYMYVDFPSWDSSRYCRRLYLAKREACNG